MMGGARRDREGRVSAIALLGRPRARRCVLRGFASQEALLALGDHRRRGARRLRQSALSRRHNLSDILLGNAYVAVAAIGMSMVIISGNIDISVGALIGVLATISGSLAVAGYPIAARLARAAAGRRRVMALQGAVVAYLRIPAIVVTLGMLSILKGGLISVTGGRWITDLPDSFHLADIELFGILPMPVRDHGRRRRSWRRCGCAIRPAGRAIYATGGNRRGGAPVRHLAAAHDRDGVRAARLFRRRRGAAVRHPVAGSSNRPCRPIWS